MIGAAIADFGDEIGLDLSNVLESGHFALTIGDVGQVHFEHRDEWLTIYLSRPIDVALDRFEVCKSAMRAVHFEQRLPARVQCAMHAEDLVFLAQYEEDEVDQPKLNEAVQMLSDLHESVRS